MNSAEAELVSHYFVLCSLLPISGLKRFYCMTW